MSLNTYREYLRVRGGNVAGGLSETTKRFVSRSLPDDPSVNIILVDDTEVLAMFSEGRYYNIANLYFEPETVVSMGSYVKIGDDIWLITDFKKGHDIFPQAEIRLCSHKLTWTQDGSKKSYYCHVDSQMSTRQDIESDRHNMYLPDENIIVMLPYNEDVEKIKHFDRFQIGNKIWRVYAIDDISKVRNNKGIVYLSMKVVPIRDSEVEDPIGEKYEVRIFGSDKVDVSSQAIYEAYVYYRGEHISSNVIWDIDDEYMAQIEDGVLTTGNESGEVTITATYTYSESGEQKEVTAEKEVRIVKPEEWW